MTVGLLVGMFLGGLCTITTLETLRWWWEFGWSKWMIIPLVLCGLPVLCFVLVFAVLTVSLILGV